MPLSVATLSTLRETVENDRADTIKSICIRSIERVATGRGTKSTAARAAGSLRFAVLAAFGLLAVLGVVAGVSLINEDVAHHAVGAHRGVSAAAAASVPSSPVTPHRPLQLTGQERAVSLAALCRRAEFIHVPIVENPFLGGSLVETIEAAVGHSAVW